MPGGRSRRARGSRASHCYFFGSQNPVGRKFDPRGGNEFDCEIVGVVQDATYSSLKEEPKRVFYIPYAQGPEVFQSGNMMLEVRSAAAGAWLAREIRQVAAQLDKNILVETETLQEHVDGSLTPDRLLALLSSLLGALSLLLVAIGVYGVMAYSVARRTDEIGIRMALGARPAWVLSMVLREGFLLVLIGAVIGIATALASSRVIASLLFGITPRDTAAFAGAAVAIGLATLLATLLPARRASRVDPQASR